jgi:hypothetical protein
MHNTKQSGDGAERPTSTDLERAARQGAAESVKRLLAMAGAWGDVNTTGPLAARWAGIGDKLSAVLVDLETPTAAEVAASIKAGPLFADGKTVVVKVERRRPDSGLADTEAEARAAIQGDLDTLAKRLGVWAGMKGGTWAACRAALETARAALETRPAAKPGPLADGYRRNFATLLKAVKAGDVALVSARRQVDGGAVALVCAVNRPGGEYELIPMAAMIDGDPFQIYEDPTADGPAVAYTGA